MIIRKNSPFRRIPDKLNRRQATFLDGIRYSVEMADLAYERLRQSLFVITTEMSKKDLGLAPSPFVGPFSDAWLIVDSVHRLREILEQMPGFAKRKSPPYQVFRRSTLGVKDFRHTIQHLRNELDVMAANGCPVWGVLNWVAVTDPEAGLVRSCVIAAGRIISGQHPLCNPLGKAIESPVDHITLHCKHKCVSLSDTIRSVKAVIAPFEKSLAEQFKDMPRTGADLLICTKFQIKLERKDEEQ